MNKIKNIINFHSWPCALVLLLLAFATPKSYAQGIVQNQVVVRSVYILMDRDKNGSLDLPVTGTAYDYTTSNDNPKQNTPYIHWINNDYDAPNYNDVNGAALALSNVQHDTQVTPPAAAAIESADDLKDLVALGVVIQPYSADIFTNDNFRLKIRTSGIHINVYKQGWSDSSATLSLPANSTLTLLHSLSPSTTYTQMATDNDAIESTGDVGVMRLAFEISAQTNQDAQNTQTTCLQTPEQCYIEVLLEDANGNQVAVRRGYVNFLPVRMAYKLPNTVLPENESERYTAGGFDDEPAAQNHKPTFRVLAGPRLRFAYKFPNGATNTSVEWRFSTTGAFAGSLCSSWTDTTCTTGTTTNNTATHTANSVYWKQTDWTLGANNAANTGTITVAATYQLNGVDACNPCEYEFQLKKRELQAVPAANPTANPPVVSDSKYMRGQDVAMLEQMLWQLGISPQYGFPGKQGDRISSISPEGPTVLAKPRNVFSSGYQFISADSRLPRARKAVGSIETMVRRFQARNATSSAHGNKVVEALLNAASGDVDNVTLGNLKRDWGYYGSAYGQYSNNPLISQADDPNLMTGWINTAVDLWTNGIGARVPVNTYTADTHNDIIRLAGLTPGVNNNRAALLTQWIGHETDRHWGHSNPGREYRMLEGGSDEHGSLSFSQLLYGHRFGQTPCAAHDDADLNIYEPGANVQTFVVHTASDNIAGAGQERCKGLMYRGFHANDQTLDSTFATDTGQINGQRGNVNDLRGYRHANGAITAIPVNEDNYDVLAKAITGYNSGEVYAAAYSWAKLLKYKTYDATISLNIGTVCHSCRYSIEVRDGIFGNSMRTYIWFGGVYPAVHPNAGQDWCFAYGESDWVAGELFTSAREQTERFIAGRNRPNDVNYEENCP